MLVVSRYPVFLIVSESIHRYDLIAPLVLPCVCVCVCVCIVMSACELVGVSRQRSEGPGM